MRIVIWNTYANVVKSNLTKVICAGIVVGQHRIKRRPMNPDPELQQWADEYEATLEPECTCPDDIITESSMLTVVWPMLDPDCKLHGKITLEYKDLPSSLRRD